MKDVKELKSKAYDLISQIEWAQNELRKTNEEIAKIMQDLNEKQKNGSNEYSLID
jgi:hypothetical protein